MLKKQDKLTDTHKSLLMNLIYCISNFLTRFFTISYIDDVSLRVYVLFDEFLLLSVLTTNNNASPSIRTYKMRLSESMSNHAKLFSFKRY